MFSLVVALVILWLAFFVIEGLPNRFSIKKTQTIRQNVNIFKIISIILKHYIYIYNAR